MSHEAADETVDEGVVQPALPLDLLLVVGYAAVAVALLSRPDVYGTPLAAALGLPLLFFVPGYALVSLLFPGPSPASGATSSNGTASAGATPSGDNTAPGDPLGSWPLANRPGRGLSGGERVALGFGVSVALLPVLGLALAASPWPIAPETVLLSVSATAVCFALAGSFRRLRRPADRRFSVGVRAWFRDARRKLSRKSLPDAALDVGLAVAVLLAVAAVGYAVAAPGPGQQYTSVTLLSQNETGELVAGDYPRNFERGEARPLVVSVTNHEGEQTRYSVVVELQRVTTAEDGGAKVLQQRRLATFTPTVDPGQTWRTTHEVTPTTTGENLRLTYLVYRGDPPTDPTTANAYRHVHVWINVTA